jgi:hypothetical protein
MPPPITMWDPQVDDDDPIAYVYDASGTIQQRIYRQHTGADKGRQWVWFCTCPKGNQYGAPRIAGDQKRDTRCDHLRRFMDEATAGHLGPGIMLTKHGRKVADTSCACNTGRRLEETPLPPRPVGDGLTSRERREKRRAEEFAERARVAEEQRERDAFETAEMERAELVERWQAQARSMGEAMRMAAEEKAGAKRKKKSLPKVKALAKKKAAPKAKKKTPTKKSKATPKKRGKK